MYVTLTTHRHLESPLCGRHGVWTIYFDLIYTLPF